MFTQKKVARIFCLFMNLSFKCFIRYLFLTVNKNNLLILNTGPSSLLTRGGLLDVSSGSSIPQFFQDLVLDASFCRILIVLLDLMYTY